MTTQTQIPGRGSGGLGALSGLAAALGALVLILAACERPFIEQAEPRIEVLSPDTNAVSIQQQIELRVRASSFRPVDRVLAGSQTLTYDPFEKVWSTDLELRPGVNVIMITAYDILDVEGILEIAVVYLSPRFIAVAPGDLTPRGDHAAVLTRAGAVLVTGGTASEGGPARDDAFVSLGDGSFRGVPGRMTVARAGHAMVNTPDGTVLLLGGARSGAVSTVSDLVETVDLFDPETGLFREIPVVGDPIRRTEHTASGRVTSEGFEVDLFGGLGDVAYRPEPRLGVRDDIRSFLFARDTLYALMPGVGGFLGVDGISGHTQASLSGRRDLAPDNYLIFGTFFGDGFTGSSSFTLDFADPLGLLPLETGSTLVPRTQHASATLTTGLIAAFGGSRGDTGPIVGSTEIYVARSGRFLDLSSNGSPFVRTRHTATKLPDNRILLVGGYSLSGNSLSVVEYFVFNAQ